MRDGPRDGHAGVAAGGLGEADPVLEDLSGRGKVGQGDTGEGQPVRSEPDRGGSQPAAAGPPMRGDPAVVNLDPGVNLVGEADGVGCEQGVDVGATSGGGAS